MPRRVRPGIFHFQIRQRVEDDLGDDEPGVFLVVGGHHEPRRVPGAGGGKTFFVSGLIILPEAALHQIELAEFPIPRRVGACIRDPNGRAKLGSLRGECVELFSLPVGNVVPLLNPGTGLVRRSTQPWS